MLIFRIESVRNPFVHHTRGHAVLKIGHGLFRRPFRSHKVGLLRARPEVRSHHIRNVRNGFFAFRILLVDVVAVDQSLFRLALAQIVLIDNPRTGAVDNHHSLFRKRKQFFIHHSAGRIVLRNMQGNHIRLREDLFHRRQFDSDFVRHRLRDHRVESENLHLESRSPFGKKTADMTQSDNSQCLPGQFTAHERFLLPFPRPGRNIRRNQFAVRGKNHRNHFLRNRIRVRSRRVHHIDVFPAGVFDVDIVVSRSRSDHQFQRGKKIHDLRRDFLAADNHRFRIRVRLRQIRKRRFHVLNDCEAFRGKNFGNNFIKFCRNQHFFHNGTSFLLFVVSSYKLLPKLPSCKPLRSNFAFFQKL